MCRIISCVFGRGFLLSWQGSVSFTLLYFVPQGQTCMLFHLSLDFLLLHSTPLWWKGHLFFDVSSRRSCGSAKNHSASAFLALVVGHKLGYCGVEWFSLQRNQDHCHFWDCTQVLHFGLFFFFFFFFWLWGLLHFFYGILAHSSRYNGHLNYILPFWSILVHWFLKCQCSLFFFPQCSLLPSLLWPPIYLD